MDTDSHIQTQAQMHAHIDKDTHTLKFGTVYKTKLTDLTKGFDKYTSKVIK